jgi:L-fucose isomerase-like protein
MAEKIRVGFVPFGFPSYPTEVMVARAHEAAEAVRALGADVVEVDLLTRVDDVPRGLAALGGHTYDVIIACVIAWTETPVVIGVLRDYLHLPILLWSRGGYSQGTQLISLGSAAGATACISALQHLGAKYTYVYDHPDAPMNMEGVKRFCRAAKAVNVLAHARMGMMGYADMGLYGLMFDGLDVRKRIGVEVESYDMLEIEQAIAHLPKARIQTQVEQWRKSWNFEQQVTQATLERVAGLTLALGDRIDERGYLAMSTKCVYGVTKHMGCTACLPQSMLGDKAHFVCENDAPGMITQTMMGLMSGASSTFMELYEIFPDRLLMGVCGFVPTSFTRDGRASVREYGWGGSTAGMVNTAQMKTGRLTLARLSLRGERYRMHLLTGEGFTPRSWEESGWAPPAPRFPALEIVLDTGVDDFAAKALAQHYGMVYGDHRQALEDLCRLLDIEVI